MKDSHGPGKTPPPFMLGPTTITQRATYWCEQPSLFVAPASQPTKQLRALAVVKWYLSTLRGQFGDRPDAIPASGVQKGPGKKQPLPSIQGEVFLGHWEGGQSTGKTSMVVEQISQSPAVTAYRAVNQLHNVRLEGYHVLKMGFKTGPRIERPGHLVLSLDGHGERYAMTIPTVQLTGFVPPPPYPELESTVHIVGNNGMSCEIEFIGKGWLSGKKNSFKAKMREEGKGGGKEVVWKVEGQWQGGSWKVTDAKGKAVESEIDTTGPVALEQVDVQPVEEQGEYESGRLWSEAVAAIKNGDMQSVKMEVDKVLAREGVPETRYFEAGTWDEADELLAKVGLGIQKEETRGVWRWKGEKRMD